MAKVIRSIFIPDAQGFIPRKATRQHHHHHSRERCVRMWAAWGVERLATAWVRTQARQEGRTGVSALAGTAAPSQTEAEGRIRPLHSLQLRVIRVTDDAVPYTAAQRYETKFLTLFRPCSNSGRVCHTLISV